jgi:lipopolysaccharide transport system ATP-binding protein
VLDEAPPTVFHISHWKAGSTWIGKILRRCEPERVVMPLPRRQQFLDQPIQKGMVYPRVLVTRQEFESVDVPEDHRRFVVIRDFRDTVVSAYFSLKISHDMTNFPGLAKTRERLQRTDEAEGMLSMLEQGMLTTSADVQRSWLDSGEPLIRYEDLLTGDVEILEPLLIDECRLQISRERLRKVIERTRFSELTGGRPRGVEDVNAHQRKGIVGDWKNHFDPQLKEAFKQRYGQLLIDTGYEEGMDW